MSVEFVDTNILLYANGSAAGAKYHTAARLIERIATNGSGAISTQVFTEFFSVATGKFRMARKDAENVILTLVFWKIHRPGHADVIRAIALHERYKIAWWDALILNSALEVEADTLWTEDFQHGQKFGPLTVRNPFA